MKYVVREIITDQNQGKTAILKARNDIEEIASNCGYQIVEVPLLPPEIAFSHATHISVYKNWKKNLPKMKAGDELIVQLPLRQHSLLLPVLLKGIKNKRVKIYGLLHDLDILRLSTTEYCPLGERIRRNLEEKKALKLCDAIIAHNKTMKEKLIEYGYDERKIVELGIFDYLSKNPKKERIFDKSIIVAGNLNKNKSGYVYKLGEGVNYNLYGIDYTGPQNEFIKYFGSFSPEELPQKVDGCFGLVWDGNSIDTCSGAYGQYLRINNPHKTSFYLACGIPVIIWKDAALADFVLKNNCGITVESLQEISNILGKMSEEDYTKLKRSAEIEAEKLTQGYYTEMAIKKAEEITIKG
jgi:glycosyltransferase involved in cell wall biosynthesis